ncbi:MAG: hypothetical protein HYR58_00935 [Acidobacteria bacterium]|nr:hypothetical protein [Acidobacteriota bacterium]
MRLVVIRQNAGDPAILAFLIPAEPPVGDRFWADELKATQDGIFLGNLKLLALDGDFHQALIMSVDIGHELGWPGEKETSPGKPQG